MSEVDYPMDGFMPATLAGKMKMAEILVKSGLLPASVDSPSKAMVILEMAHELGLKPMVAFNGIYVVSKRPALTEHLASSLVRRHPEYAGMTIKGDDKSATTVIRRKRPDGVVEEYEATFTIEDAARAKLTEKDNWKYYPQRMLKARATLYAEKDAFSDAMLGMDIVTEIEELPAKDVTPRAFDEVAQVSPVVDTIRRQLLDRLHAFFEQKKCEKEDAKEWEAEINRAAMADDSAEAFAALAKIKERMGDWEDSLSELDKAADKGFEDVEDQTQEELF